MKVQTNSSSILNKKIKILPSSKVLKPKNFKSTVKKSSRSNATKTALSKDILKIAGNEDNVQFHKKPQLQPVQGKIDEFRNQTNSLSLIGKSLHLSNKSNKSKNLKHKKSQKLSALFDFKVSQEQNIGNHLKDKSKEQNPKDKCVDVKLKNGPENHQSSKNEKNKQSKAAIITESNKCNLRVKKVADVAGCLLKHYNMESSTNSELLDVSEPVFLQFECIKIPICSTKQLRIKLPHPLVDEASDVLLITPDLKGQKIYPEKAVDHYEELLAKYGINFISKVMPIKMLKKEYSQYEMRKKLVDQFDVILADCRIIKSLPNVLGKTVMYKRKMPISVRLKMNENKLKKHLQEAISKTQMTIKSNGHTSVIQIGHSKMSPKEIAKNIVEVSKVLETQYPGGWRNIRSIAIKTSKSTALPIYLSLLSPNEVRIPVEIPKKPAPVEGELSTIPGVNVVVSADGKVVLKKVEEVEIDNSKDNEILEEAEKYIQSSKTVRHDESSNDEEKNEGNSDSDNEGEAITAAMEKNLLSKYEKNAKVEKNKRLEEGESVGEEDEDEEEGEETEESEEENEIIPIPSKKRKMQDNTKQSGPLKKQFKPMKSNNQSKIDNSDNNDKKGAIPGLKKQQKRGSRGGKKNKMSKDQRKALIKRKKAGKK